MSLKNQLTTSDYIPMNEFQEMLKSLHKDKRYKWELYCLVSVATALRVSDVLSLRWCDILNQSVIIKSELKTGKVRRIPINNEIKDRIVELYKQLRVTDPRSYIMLNRDGNVMSPEYINRELKKIKKKYNLSLDNFSTHTFRKTFGRHVYETRGRSSESLVLLMDIFNHSGIDITKRYIGLRQSEINDVYNSLTLNMD
ncbi:MAG: tyrosine-type recombinase/integrase [Bacteroidales bacterium]